MAKARPKSRAKSAPKPSKRPIHREWPSPWDELIEAYGGTAESLAEAIGTTGMTIGRWADKLVEPGEPTKRQVNQLAAARRIKPPFP